MYGALLYKFGTVLEIGHHCGVQGIIQKLSYHILLDSARAFIQYETMVLQRWTRIWSGTRWNTVLPMINST